MKNADMTTILLKALDIELKDLISKDLEQFKLNKLATERTMMATKKAA